MGSCHLASNEEVNTAKDLSRQESAGRTKTVDDLDNNTDETARVFKGNRDLIKNFGQAVSRRRRELRLTQERLAEKSGLHRTYISEVECGHRNPSLLSLNAVAEGLETSISELTKRINDSQSARPEP